MPHVESLCYKKLIILYAICAQNNTVALKYTTFEKKTLILTMIHAELKWTLFPFPIGGMQCADRKPGCFRRHPRPSTRRGRLSHAWSDRDQMWDGSCPDHTAMMGGPCKDALDHPEQDVSADGDLILHQFYALPKRIAHPSWLYDAPFCLMWTFSSNIVSYLLGCSDPHRTH